MRQSRKLQPDNFTSSIDFQGLKITGQDYIQRSIIKAIKNDIVIYAAHTNIDNVINGVNGKMADKIGLKTAGYLSLKARLY